MLILAGKNWMINAFWTYQRTFYESLFWFFCENSMGTDEYVLGWWGIFNIELTSVHLPTGLFQIVSPHRFEPIPSGLARYRTLFGIWSYCCFLFIKNLSFKWRYPSVVKHKLRCSFIVYCCIYRQLTCQNQQVRDSVLVLNIQQWGHIRFSRLRFS